MPFITTNNVVILVIIGAHIAAVYGNDAYCYKFTWIGPEYDNDTVSTLSNATCESLKLDPPCYEPLVHTFDGSVPDTDYIWEHYNRTPISCKLTRSTVCLKWVVYYSGEVEYITYTCGKMTGPHGSIKNGCETRTIGAYTTEACACSTPVINGDPRVPCNVSSRMKTNLLFIFISILSALLLA